MWGLLLGGAVGSGRRERERQAGAQVNARVRELAPLLDVEEQPLLLFAAYRINTVVNAGLGFALALLGQLYSVKVLWRSDKSHAGLKPYLKSFHADQRRIPLEWRIGRDTPILQSTEKGSSVLNIQTSLGKLARHNVHVIVMHS